MKKLLLSFGASIMAVAIALGGVHTWATAMPENFPAALGSSTDVEKIIGRALTQLAANDPDTDYLTIYGSSELRTTDISTHPSNFFQGDRWQGFAVNLVGRGSCQSIIHALSIAACGDSLAGKKVVLITSPQSFVEGGIAPDLFMANFSQQQYLTLMSDPTIPDEMKLRFSTRVDELLDEYAATTQSSRENTAASMLAQSVSDGNAFQYAVALPYATASKWLDEVNDGAVSKTMIADAVENGTSSGASYDVEEIDWDAEREKAVSEAEAATDNNDFGILNSYYTTYIGKKLTQQANKDAELSYSESKEYDDLRLLLDVCKLKGIEPLFVHVPLHGDWSDYTGFTSERRAEYYENVRKIVGQYDNVTLLDLTGYEYEKYFLCDIMHLGWKGWLEVDKAIVEYYYEN